MVAVLAATDVHKSQIASAKNAVPGPQQTDDAAARTQVCRMDTALVKS